jgi:hypothetical protein
MRVGIAELFCKTERQTDTPNDVRRGLDVKAMEYSHY